MLITHFAQENVERARSANRHFRWEEVSHKSQHLPIFDNNQDAQRALNGTDMDLWQCLDQDDGSNLYVLVPHNRVLAPCSSMSGPRVWWKPRLLDNGRGRVEPAHRIERQ